MASTSTIDALTAIVRNPKTPDLTLRQIVVLDRVIREPDAGRTVKDLSFHFLIAKPAVTRAADRLQKAGFVTRVPDPNDGRSIFIRPTPAGRKFLERHFGKASATEAV